MIIEHAVLRIKPGMEKDFERALPDGVAFIAASKGFIDLEVRPSVEKPSTYHLIIKWKTVEDHTVGFRESDRFPKWRAIVSPFFAEPPQVEHFAAPVASK